MHEMSLARALLRQVAELGRDHGPARVSEVRVECGPLAGVEPLLLAAAYQRLAGEWGLEHAELRIEEVSLLAECRDCQTTFEVLGFRFACPSCGGTQCRVVRGDALMLESVVFTHHHNDLALEPGSAEAPA